MSHKIRCNFQPESKKFLEMYVGEIVVVTTPSYANQHVMRIYDGWVSLDNPQTTWRNLGPNSTLAGTPVPCGAVLTLTVGG